MEASEMNRNLIDAMWKAIKSRHDEEAQLLARSQNDDLAHFENLMTAMDKRYSLLNQLPDENLNLSEQLPQMTRNWQQNGRYQQ